MPGFTLLQVRRGKKWAPANHQCGSCGKFFVNSRIANRHPFTAPCKRRTLVNEASNRRWRPIPLSWRELVAALGVEHEVGLPYASGDRDLEVRGQPTSRPEERRLWVPAWVANVTKMGGIINATRRSWLIRLAHDPELRQAVDAAIKLSGGPPAGLECYGTCWVTPAARDLMALALKGA